MGYVNEIKGGYGELLRLLGDLSLTVLRSCQDKKEKMFSHWEDRFPSAERRREIKVS